MGLPIVTALIGVGIGLAGVGFWTNVCTTPDFTPQVATDDRHRRGHRLRPVHRHPLPRRARRAARRRGAVVDAIDTPGGPCVLRRLHRGGLGARHVRWWASTFLHGLAVGHVDRGAGGRARRRHAAAGPARLRRPTIDRLQRCRATTPRPTPATRRCGTAGPAWSSAGRGAVAVAGLVIAAGAGRCRVLRMRLASPTPATTRAGSTTRAAYDLMAEGFGPGVNGPAARRGRPATAPPGGRRRSLADRPAPSAAAAWRIGAARSSARRGRRRGRSSCIPDRGHRRTRPPSARSHHLRDDVIPRDRRHRRDGPRRRRDRARRRLRRQLMRPACRCSSAPSWPSASCCCWSCSARLLVPLKAVVMNLLSIGAAYGVMVAVFQWGWFGGALRRRHAGPDRAVGAR